MQPKQFPGRLGGNRHSNLLHNLSQLLDSLSDPLLLPAFLLPQSSFFFRDGFVENELEDGLVYRCYAFVGELSEEDREGGVDVHDDIEFL